MMIHADLDKILPEPDALEQITQIFHEVENYKELYVITKGGRPALAVVNIDYLEELTGKPVAKDISEKNFSQKKTDEPIEVKEITNEPAETEESASNETPLIEEEEEEEESMPPSVPPATPPSTPPTNPVPAASTEPSKAPGSFNMPPSQPEPKPEPEKEIKPELMVDRSPNPVTPPLQPVPSGSLTSEEPPAPTPTPPTPAPTGPTPPTPLITPDDVDSGKDDPANSSPLL